MSFMLTAEAVQSRIKTVTRRLGWERLLPGTLLRAVRQAQGLKKGEHPEVLTVLRVTEVRRERLDRLTTELEYGFAEVAREGFGVHPTLRFPSEFVTFFCSSHRGCRPETVVTRIAFTYEKGE